MSHATFKCLLQYFYFDDVDSFDQLTAGEIEKLGEMMDYYGFNEDPLVHQYLLEKIYLLLEKYQQQNSSAGEATLTAIVPQEDEKGKLK